MTTTIRRAVSSDTETIAGYNAAMARETEHLELDRERLEQGVRAVLDDSSKGYYLLAEVEGRVVGQMMITFEWSDWRNGTFWWIQSVYVHPDYRGRGVYKQLYEQTLKQANKSPDVCGLRLYVERANNNAQQSYQRLGMEKTPYEIYEVDFVIDR